MKRGTQICNANISDVFILKQCYLPRAEKQLLTWQFGGYMHRLGHFMEPCAAPPEDKSAHLQAKDNIESSDK